MTRLKAAAMTGGEKLVVAVSKGDGGLNPVPISTPGGPPWQARPAAQVRIGRAVEAALSKCEGKPVVIDAFEVGTVRPAHRSWKIVALILLSPLWIPLFILAVIAMVIPSWIYFPCRTYREWDEAKGLGVSPGMMIFGVVLVFGFGFVGGIVMTLLAIDKLFPLGNVVALARIGDRVALLHQKLPMFNFHQFRSIEFFPSESLSQSPDSTARKVIFTLRSAEGGRTIVVRRVADWLTGSAAINDDNVRALLHGWSAPPA